MPILATKNGLRRNFSEAQWSQMPKDKFGYSINRIGQIKNNVPIPAGLVQKKMVAGATVENVKPAEIVNLKPEVPAELLPKPKQEPKKIIPKPKKEKK